jgi:hypothetical protein
MWGKVTRFEAGEVRNSCRRSTFEEFRGIELSKKTISDDKVGRTARSTAFSGVVPTQAIWAAGSCSVLEDRMSKFLGKAKVVINGVFDILELIIVRLVLLGLAALGGCVLLRSHLH